MRSEAGAFRAVLGIGPVGLLGAMKLATAGFHTYVYSREVPPNPRIDLVDAIGATYVSSQTTTFLRLAAQMGNIDLVYEVVGHSHFALQALQVLGANGIFVLTGVPGLQAFVEADPARRCATWCSRNQVLLGTVNAGSEAFDPRSEILMSSGGAGRPWYATHRRALPAGAGTGPIPGLATGIKSVIAFEDLRDCSPPVAVTGAARQSSGWPRRPPAHDQQGDVRAHRQIRMSASLRR